jgi:hypothetical protein
VRITPNIQSVTQITNFVLSPTDSQHTFPESYDTTTTSRQLSMANDSDRSDIGDTIQGGIPRVSTPSVRVRTRDLNVVQGDVLPLITGVSPRVRTSSSTIQHRTPQHRPPQSTTAVLPSVRTSSSTIQRRPPQHRPQHRHPQSTTRVPPSVSSPSIQGTQYSIYFLG